MSTANAEMAEAESAVRALPSAVHPFAWPPGRPLLTAEWRRLAMLNYEIDPGVLAPLIPAGAEIDFHNGKTYVSIVGFLFQWTRLFGAAVPGHVNFEEVNLRFYVRRRSPEGWRRGVVFVRELVPRWAVAMVANLVYQEKFTAVPLSHTLERRPGAGPHERPESLKYAWRYRRRPYAFEMRLAAPTAPLVDGSLDQFIAEHYWGYTALADGSAAEYRVAHPPWRASPAECCRLVGDMELLYGRQFADALSREPASAFWAEGSAVRVYRGRRIG